ILQREKGSDQSAGHQEYDLHDIRPRYSGEPSPKGIGCREQAESNNAVHHDTAVATAHDGVKRPCAEVKHRSEVDKDEQRYPEYRQNGLKVCAEPFFHKPGNRVDLLVDENGKKEFSH